MTKSRKQRRVNGFACPPSITIEDAVPHPRYGKTVVTTPWATTREVVLKSFWGYAGETIFPESAIAARTELQNCFIGWRGIYVDILKHCATCGRKFLFFAREQQYMFEVLKFYIAADMRHCPECRHAMHRVKGALRSYGDLINKDALDDKELKQLAKDVVLLFESGALQDEQRLRTVKNQIVKRLPTSAESQAIVRLTESLAISPSQ